MAGENELAPIEPGERFTVEYGSGRTIECVALSMRTKRKVMELAAIVTSADSEPLSKMQAIEDALAVCCPEMPDSLLDEIDEELAMQIIGGTLRKQRLSVEQAKKSESLH